jgi:FkbM family methyltransferase
MHLKKYMIRAFGKAGIGVYKIDSRKRRLFSHFGISHVIDVGANVGQFAKGLRRRVRFTGEITSFEPLSSAYSELSEYAENDPCWTAVNCGLGAHDGTLDINISENSVSSSFLSMLPSCEEAAPESKYVSHESVRVTTLDAVFKQYCSNSDSIYLKMDTQGFEKQVLDGGKNVLSYIDTVELELSLEPLYAEQMLFLEMCQFMSSLGYRIVSIEPGFSDPRTGAVLQVDGIFHRYP